jgi:diguanylate cyclase (GGDEF)-like protein/PAS domain S-box-containing protein
MGERVSLETGALTPDPHLPGPDVAFQDLLESLPVAAYVAEYRERARIRYVSPAIAELTGFGPAEWVDSDDLWARRLHPSDAIAARKAIRRRFTRGQRGDLEYRFRHADGHDIWLWDRAVARRTEDGVVVMEGVLIDITPRKRAQAGLEQSEALHRAVVHALDQGVIVLRADGSLADVNPEACRILGVPRRDLLTAKPWWELLELRFPDGTPVTLETSPGARMLATGRAIRGVLLELVRRDGTPAWIQVNYEPLPGKQDTPGAFVLAFRDVTEQRSMQREIERRSAHDELTGLWNRRRFELALAERLRSSAGHLAVGLIDVDHFKMLNDSLGHAAGDRLLVDLAAALRAHLREGDVVARLGGDEFAVLLGAVEPAQALHVTETLLGRIRAIRPGTGVTVSAGLVSTEPGTEQSAGDLLVAADIALYRAKDAGRDRVVAFTGERGSRLALVDRIRQALETDGLVLHAQPIIDLAAGEAGRHELLLRMHGEDGALLPPDAFLPTAERFGLIGELDRWVLRQAAELAAAGRRVEVNISGRTLGDPELPLWIAALLTETGAPPGHLTVEFTETAAVASLASARALAIELRRLGCRVSLDDFATGFGAFLLLKHVDVDYLKIDREFVRTLAADPQDRMIVRTIVDIARRFGLRTIAEGVEDAVSLQMLRDDGVDLAQGFHLGRPVPLQEAFGRR